MSSDYPSSRPLCALIDIAAFLHNIQRVESLATEAQAVIVIKADAYGHGLIEMAKAAGDRDLAVATSNEARELIQAGIKNRIWVLEGPFSKECLALEHKLVWAIHSEWQIDLLDSVQNLSRQECWIKIDTGMQRLGFDISDVADAYQRMSQSKQIDVAGCMTHFASSDLPCDSSVSQQISAFNSVIEQAGLKDLPISMANSGAVLYYPETHHEYVRPGIMLYGGMPNPNESAEVSGLKPVMRLVSKVMSLKRIDVGESVGYGAIWTAERQTTVAIVACGYGDGYPRHAPNGTPVWVKDRRAPLIGRVSMDMLAVDVTDVEGIEIGDEVELWGKYVPVDELALAAGTISYELLTGVTKRVPRIYQSQV